ncbi:NAC domain containing protein [Quillaja saponaria]|uniref:NAC domain containing protein n=1 Tax=Quillaja saponaria TaxID=32244 RepID=A0AAD7PW99_QUISA|nr:NAC domain containing protein [Quillaja saponaria]
MTVVSDSSQRCVRDEKAWPPGFRFHPTDEELVLYYLKKKMSRRRLRLDIIAETDVYKWDPEELPGQSKLKTGDRQWFFFSPRDRKYPNAARSNRATRHGYWKATGKDRNITCNSRTVGVKKTLVHYKGRAPTGERTDWVMHEYTMDEEELKRCQSIQDYFALYKVFKKSGPGPKNGEQYGAPFKEEEWADDECIDFNIISSDREVPVERLDKLSSVDTVGVDGQLQPPPDDEFEEFMRGIAGEPVLDQPQITDYRDALHQVVGEEETQSTLVDPLCTEVTFAVPTKVSHHYGQQSDVQPSYDFTQSATSQLKLYEAPEVSSTSNIQEQDPLLVEDFLEMDDLLGSEPTFSKEDKPVEKLQFEEIDGLSEFDLYHDAAMFLHDMGPFDQETVSHPYINAFDNNNANQEYQLLSNPELANHMGPFDQQTVSHPYLNAFNNNIAIQEYQLLSNPEHTNQIGDELWTQYQRNVFTPTETINGSFSLPTTGVVSESADCPAEGNHNQNSNVGEGATSRFSSALWTFVESIPTTPASASENALVNRAIERMSSFSRMRINVTHTNIDTAADAARIRGAGRKGVFFYFFPVLVAFCAILWVSIGTLRLTWRCIS